MIITVESLLLVSICKFEEGNNIFRYRTQFDDIYLPYLSQMDDRSLPLSDEEMSAKAL